jgi:hypothetical protein
MPKDLISTNPQHMKNVIIIPFHSFPSRVTFLPTIQVAQASQKWNNTVTTLIYVLLILFYLNGN